MHDGLYVSNAALQRRTRIFRNTRNGADSRHDVRRHRRHRLRLPTSRAGRRHLLYWKLCVFARASRVRFGRKRTHILSIRARCVTPLFSGVSLVPESGTRGAYFAAYRRPGRIHLSRPGLFLQFADSRENVLDSYRTEDVEARVSREDARYRNPEIDSGEKGV